MYPRPFREYLSYTSPCLATSLSSRDGPRTLGSTCEYFPNLLLKPDQSTYSRLSQHQSTRPLLPTWFCRLTRRQTHVTLFPDPRHSFSRPTSLLFRTYVIIPTSGPIDSESFCSFVPDPCL